MLAALLTSHITEALAEVPVRGSGRAALVDRVVAVAEHLAERRPGDGGTAGSELALVYIAQRLGNAVSQMLIDALAADLRAAQRDGTGAVRAIPASWPRWCC